MGTTKANIKEWLGEGIEQGATHTIIVCDTYDWDDYPVHVMPGQDVKEKEAEYGDHFVDGELVKDQHPMQKIMEIYNLSMDIDEQIDCGRVRNY